MYRIKKYTGYGHEIRFKVQRKTWIFWVAIADGFSEFERASNYITQLRDASEKVNNFNNQKRKS